MWPQPPVVLATTTIAVGSTARSAGIQQAVTPHQASARRLVCPDDRGGKGDVCRSEPVVEVLASDPARVTQSTLSSYDARDAGCDAEGGSW